MRFLTTKPITFALAGAVLLGAGNSALLADGFTFDNSCGGNLWHWCCDYWEGENHHMDNNWDAGAPLWPDCPAMPEGGDDVDVGAHFVILNGGATVNSFTSNGVFQFEDHLLSVAVNATYNGPVLWYAGGFGNGTHYVNGGLDAMGLGDMYVSYGTVNQSGLTTWTGTSDIWIDFDGVFNNLPGATFDVQNDATIQRYAYGSTFNNAGTFIKSGGAGTTRVNMDTTFNNSGLVDIQVGTMVLEGPGTSSGTFNMAAGATILFHRSAHTIQDGASFTGEGFARVANNGGITIPDQETATAENFEVYHPGGISGPGTLSVTDTLNWTGGGMSNGTTRVENTAALNISGADEKHLNYLRILDNAGLTTWTGTGEFWIDFGAVFNNLSGATFDIQNDSTIQYYAGASTFNNAGTFTKSAGVGTTQVNRNTTFNNSGLVDVQVGTLRLDGPGASGGTFNMAAGATVEFRGTHTLQDGASLTGAGLARVVTNAAFTIPDQETATAENLDLAGGISGPGTLSVTDTLNWTGGGMRNGTTSVENRAALNISGADEKHLNYQRVVDNAGTATWTGTGEFWIDFGAVFNNLPGGAFDIQNDSSIQHYAGGRAFNNAGRFTKSDGVGTTRVHRDTTFRNSGIVEALSGTLQFDGGYTQTAGATILDGGNINGALNLRGGVVRGEGTLSPDLSNAGGEVAPGLSAGTLTIGDDYTQTATGILEIEIGGSVPGVGHDVLQVADVASLNGILNVTLIDDYMPGDGEAFTILTANTVTGTFASENLPALPDELVWHVSYGTDRVTLVVGYDCNANGLPDQYDQFADFNGDGDLDLTDYADFAGCLTAPCGPEGCDPPLYGDACCALADVEPNGDVDLVDFAAIQRGFGG